MFVRCLLCRYRTTCHADLDAKRKELHETYAKLKLANELLFDTMDAYWQIVNNEEKRGDAQ